MNQLHNKNDVIIGHNEKKYYLPWQKCHLFNNIRISTSNADNIELLFIDNSYKFWLNALKLYYSAKHCMNCNAVIFSGILK